MPDGVYGRGEARPVFVEASAPTEEDVYAALLKAPFIERILEHRRLPAQAPPRTPARASMSQAA